MLHIDCRGTPYEIGHQHGRKAKTQVARCIDFYAQFFQESSRKTWPEVLDTAKTFEEDIKAKWPRYYEEIRGIADGAERDILDIIAINVRTEIAFGLMADGCTSLYWKSLDHTFLGQNWDWKPAQKQNLVYITIYQDSLPTIKMITEAGMLGKIGLNSSNVGVCFNAIRAPGLDTSRMPVHLGLRLVLESSSAAEAISSLEKVGLASAAHMLIGDANDATGLEFTSSTIRKLKPDPEGRISHSNHFLLDHDGVKEREWMPDTFARVKRITELTAALSAQKKKGGLTVALKDFGSLFEDQDGYPGAICRKADGDVTSETLFNIVMDLRCGHASVKLGRPCDVEWTAELTFDG